MPGLELKNIRKSFGKTEVLKGLSLTVDNGEFLSLVGESGCGKSTLLRIISGLETPDTGDVIIDGHTVTGKVPKQRNIAMVFQDYALYPHMSVGQNIAMPLIMAQLPLLSRLPILNMISPKARSARPSHCSRSGKCREAAAHRAFVGTTPGRTFRRTAPACCAWPRPGAEPETVFLMDEPLSNLDAKLRVEVRKEITELHHSSGLTFVYVTHDQTEAMTMSDRVALLQTGKLLQLGKPGELYSDPQSVDVARFIGSPEINILPAIKEGTKLKLGNATLDIKTDGDSKQFSLGLRPECVHLDPTGTKQKKFKLPFLRNLVEDLGHEFLVHGSLEDLADAPMRLRIQKSPKSCQCKRYQ